MTWFVADLHFGHRKVVEFRRRYANELPTIDFLDTFADSDEHDEYVIQRWNDSGIRKRDTVFVLGDVAFNGRGLSKVLRLTGRKSLVMGNHDNMPASRYIEAGFVKVYGAAEFDGNILTHIPVAKDCVRPRYKYNIHGHTHDKVMIGEQYKCVSLEQIGMRPINYEDLKLRSC